MKLFSFAQSLTGLALVSLLILTSSCKKSTTVDPTKGFSAKIQSIISQSDVDALRAKGMIINEGSVPPNIEGIFVSSPHRLVAPYGPQDTYAVGDDFNDLIMRFSGQNTADQTALVEIKNAGSSGSGQGGFLAGNGQKFTFFAEINVVAGVATAKQIRIFTGEMTADGIKDFYTTLLMKSKTDPNDELIPVGSARILKDGDGLASKRSSFRRSAEATATAEEMRR